MSQYNFKWLARAALASVALCISVSASAVALQNGTATFSQTFDRNWFPSQAIDGNAGPGNGWAIFAPGTSAQTAVWETVNNYAGDGMIVDMAFNHGDRHLLGRFRISTTTDDRALFADGLPTGGDVSANWTALTPSSVTASGGLSSSVLGDGSVLIGGSVPSTATYSVRFDGALAGITGIRLEAMEDPSLPTNGPGLQPNGNFVLSEITMAPVPEPSSLVLLGIGAAVLCNRRRRL